VSLAQDFVRAADPPALAEAMDVRLYPWQRRLLRSRDRRIAVVAPRQGGKTLTLAVKALHQALFAPQTTSLVLSATERQARECFRYVLMGYRRLARPVPSEVENRLSLELENGSRVVVVPASPATVRGYAADLLAVDECAFVEDQLLEAIFPMLAVTEGQVILASTPNGRRGFFAEVFLGTDPAWTRLKVTVADCTAISPAVVEEFARTYGEDRAREEFGGEFLDSERQAFLSDDVDRALGKVEAWNL
jgi:hypothetical protein